MCASPGRECPETWLESDCLVGFPFPEDHGSAGHPECETVESLSQRDAWCPVVAMVVRYATASREGALFVLGVTGAGLCDA